MNEHDKSNYLFLMSLTPQQFDEWFDGITDDDVQYAMELLQQARIDLAEQYVNALDPTGELTEARTVLDKFTLNGIK